MTRVAVVGAGVAGTAAAWQAARRGAAVTVVHAGVGASALYSGALDRDPWDEGRRPRPVDAAVLSFATALEAWTVGPVAARVVTGAGVVRSAQGIDAALLDVEPLAGKRVAVADAPAYGVDGAALSRALDAAAWSRDTGTEFLAVAVEPPGLVPEPAVSAYDQAARLDSESRARAFADHLRDRGSEHAGWLVGPWLGTTSTVAEVVRARLGKPVGEMTSEPGGPAGARFENARRDMFAGLDVVEQTATVTRVAREGEGWDVRTDRESIGQFDAVILAVGGLVGGGLFLRDPGPREQARFALSLDAPVDLALHGRVLDAASTLYGVDLAVGGASCIENVGVHCLETRAVGTNGLFVAGDAMADQPRTALRAAESGIRAAKLAAA